MNEELAIQILENVTAQIPMKREDYTKVDGALFCLKNMVIKMKNEQAAKKNAPLAPPAQSLKEVQKPAAQANG